MGKKIADMAHAYDILVAPHNCHSPLNTLVSANVCATMPNFFIQELDVDDAPWRDDLMTHPFVVEDGYLQLSERTGLGFGSDRSGVGETPADQLSRNPLTNHCRPPLMDALLRDAVRGVPVFSGSRLDRAQVECHN